MHVGRRTITSKQRGNGLPGRLEYITSVTGYEFDSINSSLLDLVRRVRNCVAHGSTNDPDDAIAAGIGAIWFQLDLGNDGPAHRAEDRGLKVVWDRCTAIEHRRLPAG